MASRFLAVSESFALERQVSAKLRDDPELQHSLAGLPDPGHLPFTDDLLELRSGLS